MLSVSQASKWKHTDKNYTQLNGKLQKGALRSVFLYTLKVKTIKSQKFKNNLTFSIDKSQKVNYHIVKVERTKGQKIRKSYRIDYNAFLDGDLISYRDTTY